MPESIELLKNIVELKPGGEIRTQQQTAVEEIDHAITEKTNLLLEAPTGSGKALALETPILTSAGWSTMGDLKTGEKVYGTNGELINIVQAHEPFESKALYQITFNTGEVIEADAEHLWHIHSAGDEEKRPVNNARVETISTKSLILVQDDKEIAVETLLEQFPLPSEIINISASFVSVLEETENIIKLPLVSFMETVYVEMLGRSATWTTEELYWHMTRTPDLSLFQIKTTKPLVFQKTENKLPARARLFGEWLAGQQEVFDDKEYEALVEEDIHDNLSIPDIYKYSSVKNREQLLLGMLLGHESGVISTSILELAEDISFVASSLGIPNGLWQDPERTGPGMPWFVMIAPKESRDFVDIVSIRLIPTKTVRCITVDSEDHLFLAGKGLIPTHNTLSYLIPVVNNETRAVISTATKQLSEQIMDVDIKFLNKALKELKTGKRADAVLLKGRDNYLCLSKFDDMRRLEDTANTLFSVEETSTSNLNAQAQKIVSEAGKLVEWADTTTTGDRSHGPAVSEETWRQYSSTNVECPGKSSCPFGDVCFAEAARDKAKAAQIVVTNHAIVALDLASEGQLLGDREAFIFDELHELDNYTSAAWGAELTYRRIEATHKLLKSIPSLDETAVAELKNLLEDYNPALRSVEPGLLDNNDTSIKLENFIIRLYNASTKLSVDITRKNKEANSDALKRIYSGAKKTIDELAEIANVLTNTSIDNVRWIADNTERKRKPTTPAAKKARILDKNENGSTLSLHAAPLQIGPKLQNYLSERDAIMVGLSATVTVQGNFDIPLQNFGLSNKPNRTVAVDTPFDYSKQVMLYIPNPSSFPSPVGEERFEHEQAVKKEAAEFVKAARGRSLILSTTSKGVETYSEYLRQELKGYKILAQGDAPSPQLVQEFKDDHEASLVGTMGFWHGLDAPGSTLIFVGVDKFPFPSPNDPLLLARKNHADRQGRNGFMEVYVTIAEWMARQAFGRAIRTKTDRAVVAFWEPRIITKQYGRAFLNNLTGVKIYHNKQLALDALGRLSKSVQ